MLLLLLQLCNTLVHSLLSCPIRIHACSFSHTVTHQHAEKSLIAVQRFRRQIKLLLHIFEHLNIVAASSSTFYCHASLYYSNIQCFKPPQLQSWPASNTNVIASWHTEKNMLQVPESKDSFPDTCECVETSKGRCGKIFIVLSFLLCEAI